MAKWGASVLVLILERDRHRWSGGEGENDLKCEHIQRLLPSLLQKKNTSGMSQDRKGMPTKGLTQIRYDVQDYLGHQDGATAESDS